LYSRLPLEDIRSISLSQLADGVFVLHTSSQDHVFESEKKTEIVTIISELLKDLKQGANLPINFNNT
jgi:hypothetical protein